MSDSFIDEKDDNHAKRFAEAVGSYFQNGDKGSRIESFAELLESYNAGINQDIRIGDKVSGEIIYIGADAVFVNTWSKIDGAVDKVELLDENGELPYKIGDVLDLFVTGFDEYEIRLSKALSGIGELNILEEAFETGTPVEGKVIEVCKGGFNVEILKKKAFCPISQIDMQRVEDPQEYIGQSLPFLIIRFEENGRNIVVSRREILEQEARAAKEAFMETVFPGTVLKGKVSSVMDYGVFVELFPGIEGMAHVSELSWARVEKPADILRKDDPIVVKVIDIRKGSTPDQLKISLSVKQITGDPWETVSERFRPGDKVRGKVIQCMNFGVFVELVPGVEGLVHVSEMSYTKRVSKPEDEVQAGETVEVMIKEIDAESRRISLSMRDAEGDPWIGIKEKYKIGQSVDGTVEKKEKFGYFINLEPGVTGLLPKSKISKSHNPSQIERLKPGDLVTIIVEEIHPRERKMTLGPGDSRDEDDWKKYTKDSGPTSLGSLGEKLQQALKLEG